MLIVTMLSGNLLCSFSFMIRGVGVSVVMVAVAAIRTKLEIWRKSIEEAIVLRSVKDLTTRAAVECRRSIGSEVYIHAPDAKRQTKIHEVHDRIDQLHPQILWGRGDKRNLLGKSKTKD